MHFKHSVVVEKFSFGNSGFGVVHKINNRETALVFKVGIGPLRCEAVICVRQNGTFCAYAYKACGGCDMKHSIAQFRQQRPLCLATRCLNDTKFHDASASVWLAKIVTSLGTFRMNVVGLSEVGEHVCTAESL